MNRRARKPQRPQQHVLRDQAITELRRVVEDLGWLLRKRDGDEDYGLDGDIEIFIDEESAGLEFPVQIKGTAKVNGRPKVRIEWSSWEYWRDQANPVLVVLWERETDRIWWQWAHRFDTTGIDRGSRQFTFRFPENQIWSDDLPATLLEEVQAYRAWPNWMGHLPISVVVQGSGTVGGVNTRRVVGRLRQRLAGLNNIVELRQAHRGLLRIDVRVSGDRTSIWISGGPSVVIHHEYLETQPPDSGSQQEFLDYFTADLLIGVARHLIGIGARGPGARVAEVGIDDSTVVFEPEVALPIIDLLIEARRWQGLDRLLSRLLVAGDASLTTLVIHMLDVQPLDPEAQQRIGDTLMYAVRARETGLFDPGGAAIIAYNASVLLRSNDPLTRSVFLDEAARLDPAYQQRSYWWREKGGALFMLDDFEGAVEHYQRAVDLGEKEAAAPLADALLFAGRYGEALATFDDALDGATDADSEWKLKRHMVRWLVETIGIREQNRDPEEAKARLSEATEDLSSAKGALEYDALCGDALWRLGHALQSKGERSADAFAATALVETHSSEAWSFAIVSAEIEEPQMLHDIAVCARRHVGQELLSHLETGDAPEEAIAYIQDLFEHLPPDEETPLETRIAPTGSATYQLLDDMLANVLDER